MTCLHLRLNKLWLKPILFLYVPWLEVIEASVTPAFRLGNAKRLDCGL